MFSAKQAGTKTARVEISMNHPSTLGQGVVIVQAAFRSSKTQWRIKKAASVLAE
jgi:hypothetical protein